MAESSLYNWHHTVQQPALTFICWNNFEMSPWHCWFPVLQSTLWAEDWCGLNSSLWCSHPHEPQLLLSSLRENSTISSDLAFPLRRQSFISLCMKQKIEIIMQVFSLYIELQVLKSLEECLLQQTEKQILPHTPKSLLTDNRLLLAFPHHCISLMYWFIYSHEPACLPCL